MRLSQFIGTALLCVASPAVAGQWSSGGGELFRDTKNPWFPKSLAVARYCVVLDEATFGVDRRAAGRAVEKAIAFWKSELTGTTFGFDVDVGTQQFVEMSCDGSEDLKFQMGVLDAEQERFLEDPTRFAAISVRTDFDLDTRRGKGFVYIAPERGRLRPASVNLRPDPWSAFDGRLLELVLMHELGHVFGIGHYSPHGLMDERFVDFALNRNVTSPLYLSEDPQVVSFRQAYIFDLGPCWGAVGQMRLRYEFFDIPQEFACTRIDVRPDRIVAQAKRSASDETWTDFGSAALTATGASERVEPLIFEYLPGSGTLWLRPEVRIRTLLGLYRSTRGVEREVFVVLEPGDPRVGGVLENHVIPDLSYPFVRVP